MLCTQLGAEGAEVDCVGTQVWVDSGQTKQVLNLVIPFGRTVTVCSLSKDGVLAGGGVRLKSQLLGVFSSRDKLPFRWQSPGLHKPCRANTLIFSL